MREIGDRPYADKIVLTFTCYTLAKSKPSAFFEFEWPYLIFFRICHKHEIVKMYT